MQLSDEIINAFVKTLPNGEKDNSNGYELYYGTVKVSNGKTSVILDGSPVETPLNYLTMGAENGDRVTCIIKDHSLIVTGNLTHPSEGMTTKYIETMTVLAQEAAIGKLIATEGDFTELTADSAFVKRLMSDQVGASILTADEAFVGSLQTQIVTADKIKAMQAEIGYVDAETLEADYLQADMANLKIVEATKASIASLLADMAFVKNATISQGHITGELDSVTLNANYITAGSLSVDRLYINGPDGKPRLVEFNEDGAPVATTIDASILTDRTITADKIVANSITANEISTDFITAFKANIMETVTENLHAVTAEIEKLISGDTELDTLTVSGDAVVNGELKVHELKLDTILPEIYGGTGSISFYQKWRKEMSKNTSYGIGDDSEHLKTHPGYSWYTLNTHETSESQGCHIVYSQDLLSNVSKKTDGTYWIPWGLEIIRRVGYLQVPTQPRLNLEINAANINGSSSNKSIINIIGAPSNQNPAYVTINGDLSVYGFSSSGLSVNSTQINADKQMVASNDITLNNGSRNSPSVAWHGTNRHINSGIYNSNDNWWIYDTTNNKAILRCPNNNYMITEKQTQFYSGLESRAGWMDWYIDSQNRGSIFCNVNNDTSFYVRANVGNMYVGSQKATVAIYSAGDIYMKTEGSLQVANNAWNAWKPVLASNFSVQSSRLVKENIVNMTDTDANKILELRPVRFDYKENFGGQKNRSGLIAEEAIEIIPDSVIVPDGYDENEFNEDNGLANKIMSIDYSSYVPYLIKLCQTQQKQIDTLSEELAELRKIVDNIS